MLYVGREQVMLLCTPSTNQYGAIVVPTRRLERVGGRQPMDGGHSVEDRSTVLWYLSYDFVYHSIILG